MATWKDSANPFNKLVNTVTFDDNQPNVPYYQTEQIKDASFQSDHGCESIHKALMYRLDHGTPCVQHKCLFLVRTLMLEGPAGFGARMSSNMGKINSLANNSEVKKGSLEESVKQISGAVQQAVNGDSKALARVASQGTAPEKEANKLNLKSDFQLQQERELKAFKQQQRKRGSSEILVNEKLLQQFDTALTPAKFVTAALNAEKKKYSADELVAFNMAAQDTTSVSDVASALDHALREGASPLAIRYKALQLVDALLPEGVSDSEAMRLFRTKTTGIQRHTTLERSDNPTKSAMTQTLAQSIMVKINNANIQAVETNKVQQQEGSGKFSSFAAAPTPATASIDDMFGGMKEVSPGRRNAQPVQQPQPQQQQATGGWGNDWGQQPQASQQQPQQQVQFTPQVQQFQQPQMPQQQFQSQQFQPQQFQPQAQAPLQHPAQQMPQQQQFQPLAQTPQAPPPAQAPPVQDLNEQMLAFQRNMAMMQAMMQGGGGGQQQPPAQPVQQQAPPQVQPAQPAWGSTAMVPPPIPEPTPMVQQQQQQQQQPSAVALGSSTGSFDALNLNSSHTGGGAAMVSSSHNGSAMDLTGSVQEASRDISPEQQQPLVPPPPPAVEAAPPVVAQQPAQSFAPSAETIAMLQAQMAETQKVMLQQQQMLATLLQQQQQPPQE